MVFWSTVTTPAAKRVDNFKVIFIGNVAAGKTSIIQHYVVGKFLDHVDSTIGASFACAESESDDCLTKLHIWDTAGQERYRGIISIYYRGADVAVIVCDLTNPESIESVEFWIKDFKDRTNNENAKVVIVGNKIDLITDENKQNAKLEEISKTHNYPVIYASARDATNLNEIFNHIYGELKSTTPFDVKAKLAIETAAKEKSILGKWCHLL